MLQQHHKTGNYFNTLIYKKKKIMKRTWSYIYNLQLLHRSTKKGPNSQSLNQLQLSLASPYKYIYQALRIDLVWSSEAIYFSTHQFELSHHKIIFFCIGSIAYYLNHSVIFFCKTISYFCGLQRFCPSKNLVFRFTSRKSPSVYSI